MTAAVLSRSSFDEPPETRTASHRESATAIASSSASRSSLTIPRWIGRQPRSATKAPMRYEFASRTSPGPGTRSVWTSSFPVDMIPIAGGVTTETRPAPTAAATPISRGDRERPRSSTTCPARKSSPWKTTFSPGATGRRTSRSPPIASACSIITTASAPQGRAPPVGMYRHRPGDMLQASALPIPTRPRHPSIAGMASDAPVVSAAATA